MQNNPFFPIALKEGGWYIINKGGIEPAAEQPECQSGYAILQFPHVSGQCTAIGAQMAADGILLTTIAYEDDPDEDEMRTEIETTGFPFPCILRVLECNKAFRAELWAVNAAEIVETENWNAPESPGLGASELEQIALGLRAEAETLCLPTENPIWQYAERCELLAFPPVQITITEAGFFIPHTDSDTCKPCPH